MGEMLFVSVTTSVQPQNVLVLVSKNLQWFLENTQVIWNAD